MAFTNWKIFFTLIFLPVLIPFNVTLAGECLMGSQTWQFRVYEREIDYQLNYDDSDYDALKALYPNASLKRVDLAPDGSAFRPGVKSLDGSTPKSHESMVVDGIANFIEVRAEAELRLWFINFISEEICVEEDNAGELFPKLCGLELHNPESMFAVEQQYLALVQALREDLQYLPACIIQRKHGSDLGYILHSVFEGYANNGKLDELLYGLGERFENHEFKHEFEEVFVFAIFVYSSALEVKPIWGADNTVEAKEAAVVKFLLRLNDRIKTIENKNVRLRYDNYFQKMLEEFFETRGNIRLRERMREFYRLRELIVETTAEIKKAENREKVESLFSRSGRLLFEQLMVLLRFDGMKHEISEFNDNMNIVRALYAGYQSIEVHEYTRAILELRPVLDSISKNSKVCRLKERVSDGNSEIGKDCKYQKQLKTFNMFSGALVSLAEAKSEDDFSARLDKLASPVGAWRLKKQMEMTSITALPGIRISSDKYSSPGLPGSHEEDVYGIGAPLGVQWSWPLSGERYWGVMVSLLDLGNIIDAPSDIETPYGRISGDVDSSFSNVFTPGIYFNITPFKNSPFNLVAGYSKGPSSGYRNLLTDSGETFPVERDSMISISLSVDVTFFTF